MLWAFAGVQTSASFAVPFPPFCYIPFGYPIPFGADTAAGPIAVSASRGFACIPGPVCTHDDVTTYRAPGLSELAKYSFPEVKKRKVKSR